jgi:hypothetical protein
VDDYEKMRATMLNLQFGYVGFAADVFGADFAGEDNSTLLREQLDVYRGNNSLFYGRIQAAVDVMKGHPDVMPDKIAIIGCECFLFSVRLSVCLFVWWTIDLTVLHLERFFFFFFFLLFLHGWL